MSRPHSVYHTAWRAITWETSSCGEWMQAQGGTRSVMSERAKWIPLRLDLKVWDMNHKWNLCPIHDVLSSHVLA